MNQLQLTLADFLVEIHDTHHPLSVNLYYEDQKPESERRTGDFRESRAPKYLGWFERVLKTSGGPFLTGRKLTYADLSLFQVAEGLRYAFPKASAKWEKKHPRVAEVRARVAARPRIRKYVASGRRIPFNEMGIFRRYAELDG